MEQVKKEQQNNFCEKVLAFTNRIFEKYRPAEKMISFPLLVYLRNVFPEVYTNTKVIYQPMYGHTQIQEVKQHLAHYVFHFDFGHILSNSILAEQLTKFILQQRALSASKGSEELSSLMVQQRAFFSSEEMVHLHNLVTQQGTHPVPERIERLHKRIIQQCDPFYSQELVQEILKDINNNESKNSHEANKEANWKDLRTEKYHETNVVQHLKTELVNLYPETAQAESVSDILLHVKDIIHHNKLNQLQFRTVIDSENSFPPIPQLSSDRILAKLDNYKRMVSRHELNKNPGMQHFLSERYPMHNDERPVAAESVAATWDVRRDELLPDKPERVKDIIYRNPEYRPEQIAGFKCITDTIPQLIPQQATHGQEKQPGVAKEFISLFTDKGTLPVASAKQFPGSTVSGIEPDFSFSPSVMMNTITDKITASDKFEKIIGSLLSKKIPGITDRVIDSVKKKIQLDEHRKGFH